MTLPTFDPEYELAGRVGTIVIERAQLQVSNGIPTEGQRTLFRKVNYDSENRQSEELNYDQNGILTSRSLHFYDGGGDLRVIKTYSPDGSLIHRRVYNENLENRTIEELAYSGRGTPEVTKTVYSLDENGKIVRQTTLTSFGQPSITLLMHYDKQDKVSEVSICVSGSENLAIIPGPAGKSVELSVEMRNTLHRVGYCSDGLLTSRTAFTRDPAGHLLEVATYTADGVLVSRESHAREYDSHGNWIKETVSKWKSDSSEFEPVLLTYRKIAYRD